MNGPSRLRPQIRGTLSSELLFTALRSKIWSFKVDELGLVLSDRRLEKQIAASPGNLRVKLQTIAKLLFLLEISVTTFLIKNLPNIDTVTII